jgi:hypothetical protein
MIHTMKRASAAAALVIGAAIVGVAAGAERSATATRLHRVAVFDGHGLAKDLTIQSRVSGFCWTQSLVVDRTYSWRCLHRNDIYDPCFSATSGSSVVVCPTRPWARTVDVIHITRPLPHWSRLRFNPRFPWGIWTTNHKRCFSYAGSATDEVAGRGVTYGCEGGGLLVGLANRRGPQWTIHFASDSHAKRAVLVGVTDVWT